MNFILDITPDDGYRMVYQGSPGWIASMTDFWVTGGGMVVVETTMVGYQGYDVDKVPEYVRARNASQFGESIDHWVKLMDAQNNGGYANMWLIGDIKTGEIANYEQGLIYQLLEKKTNGYFFGANAPTILAFATWRAPTPVGATCASRPAPGMCAGRSSSISITARSTPNDRADDAGGYLRSLPGLHQPVIAHDLRAL